MMIKDAETTPGVTPRFADSTSLVSFRYAWFAIFSLLVLSTAAVLPSAYRSLLVISPENLPDTYWTVEEMMAALYALHLTLPIFGLFQLVIRFVPLAGFFMISAVIFFMQPTSRGALVIAALLAVSAWGTFGIANLYESLFPAYQVLFRILSLLCFNLFSVLLLVFPDGRFNPRWTLWLSFFMLVSSAFNAFDSPLNSTLWPFPLDLSLPIGEALLILYAVVYRYRKVFNARQRQQSKWVIFSLFFLLFGFLFPSAILYGWVPEFSSPGVPGLLFYLFNQSISSVALLLIPTAILVSILGYRLWDIDLLINRSTVIGLITAVNLVIYLSVTWLSGQILFSLNNSLPGFIAAGVMLLVYQPLRLFVRGGVNKLMYGDREDPYTVIARLVRQLETSLAPDSVLPVIVRTVKETFKLPYAAVAIRKGEGFEIAAAEGVPGETTLHIPLTYLGESVGQLTFSPTRSNETMNPNDRQLLDDIVRQAGLTVYAHRVALDLQLARLRLVNAREEERKRIQRDLHDGLGPQLAGLAMKLELAQTLRSQEQARSTALLSEIYNQLKETITFVRRLVYVLRPPVLEHLGLTAAIREFAMQEIQSRGIAVQLELPDADAPLPAALEVTLYYIAVEALTNIARHAKAASCELRLSLNNEIHLEISDDGVGIPPGYTAGVGIYSMRERAVELGGSFEVGRPHLSGTALRVRLPLHQE